jgi:hypothetical protein
MEMDCLQEIELRPSAAKLLESMRDIGYSFESALADIVDNSVSADATWIEVINDLDPQDLPFVAIIDNGRGMSGDELTAAMRHGSRSPRESRGQGDLGRFGLGLKTASFSQCRRLTVVSRKDGQTSARCWDLDHVVSRDDWFLQIPASTAIAQLPGIENLPETGTLVVWQKLDRLDAEGSSPDRLRAAMNILFSLARAHLALTFHRFIQPEPGERSNPLSLRVNGMALEAPDPFALHMTPRSEAHEVEIIRVPEGDVIVQAFTLPHHQRLTTSQLNALSLGSSLSQTQGFYIYRARRLIAGGTWLGLARRSEISRLLRVRVDVPTALDSDWSIDVRKSRIRPPAAVRNRLRPLVERMTSTARRPYEYRGRSQAATRGMPVWLRTLERGQVRYEISRDHLLVRAVRALLDGPDDALEAMLRGIEATLPLDVIFSDMSDNPRQMEQCDMSDEQLRNLLAIFIDAVAPDSEALNPEQAERILQTPPFSGDKRARDVLARMRPITGN